MRAVSLARRIVHRIRPRRIAGGLLLEDFRPASNLEVATQRVRRAKFPAIDAHSHLGRWLTRNGEWSVDRQASILRVLEACNIHTAVNLDGMWGDELERNLDRYDRAYPGRFVTFAQCDWSLVTNPDFGARLARQLEDSARRGAQGLKVWKTLGLHHRDAGGRLIPIHDERLAALWETAGALHLPVLMHIADPVAFFRPLDAKNERWEELSRNPEWHVYDPGFPAFSTLIEQFEQLIATHPGTTFIGAHVGCYAENLTWVSRMLDTYPNLFVDISARLSELGRQPYSARRLFEQHPSRILFGIDGCPPTRASYAPYLRFLESYDEYFPYSRWTVGPQGRWNIYGIGLPDEILRQVYFRNAAQVLRLSVDSPT